MKGKRDRRFACPRHREICSVLKGQQPLQIAKLEISEFSCEASRLEPCFDLLDRDRQFQRAFRLLNLLELLNEGGDARPRIIIARAETKIERFLLWCELTDKSENASPSEIDRIRAERIIESEIDDGLLQALPDRRRGRAFQNQSARKLRGQVMNPNGNGIDRHSSPETLISNQGAALREFAAHRPSITKAIGNGSHLHAGQIRTGYTLRAAADSFPTQQSPFTIGLVQSAIIPAAMWRIVTVGTRCYGFRLAGMQLVDEIDSRRVEEKLAGGPESVPTDVSEGLLRMMRHFGILYSSSDFIEDESGNLWFIDLNPEGQWGAYEQRFGVPISDHIIEEIDT